MLRTQIYLTEKEQAALRAIARQKGTSQSEIIREAIDQFIMAYSRTEREQLMRAAFGIWADRDDFDLKTIRAEFDRSPERQD